MHQNGVLTWFCNEMAIMISDILHLDASIILLDEW